MRTTKTLVLLGVVMALGAGCNALEDLEALRTEPEPPCELEDPCDGCTPRNDCGGCGELSEPVGEECGTCGSGSFQCDEETQDTVCVGDQGEASRNACGGCSALEGAPGGPCGTCETGVFECDRQEAVVCMGDQGNSARNACGGCGALTGEAGDACGTCDSGALACGPDMESFVCMGDAGEAARNICGGCDELVGMPGDACGNCGTLACDQESGTLVCDDIEAPTWFQDLDGDGFGNDAVTQEGCEQPEGFVARGGDCVDQSFDNNIRAEEIHPDALEVADDNLDNNCDGLVQIGPGSFSMGSPANEERRGDDETAHQVTFSYTLEVETTEVTLGQWGELIPSTPDNNTICDADDCPVSCVNWFETLAYLNARSQADGLDPCYDFEGSCTGTPGIGTCTANGCVAPNPNAFTCTTVTFAGLTCNGWRLPTEAEWERFARSGTTTAFWTGQLTQPNGCQETRLEEMAWYCNNSGNRSHPVGEKRKNFFQIFDTSGNVAEWVWDLYDDFTADAATDPIGPEMVDINRRVHRGGGWNADGNNARSAARSRDVPGCQNRLTGFRAVRTIPSE